MTNIKKIRLQRNIKASALAKLLQISRAAVCDIEKKGVKQAKTAQKYAEILKCKPEELFDF